MATLALLSAAAWSRAAAKTLRPAWKVWRGLLLLLVAPVLALAAAERPNILWIVSEDNSPNLGCYGDPYARTPNLDRLAAEGVRFSNAFVPYSVCSPSRAAYLTGLYPQQNGQLGLATHRFAMYAADTPNVVTLLKAAGYRTGILGKLHVNPESAFPFDFRPGTRPGQSVRGVSASHVDNAAQFWRETGSQPWFLSVNFPDAHLSRWFSKHPEDQPARPRHLDDVRPLAWAPLDTPRLREVVSTYYDGMDRLDEAVGRLLAALAAAGLAENTLVVYISDHGAQFIRGKYSVYEGGLRIPMLLRWPGKARAALVRDELVSTLDMLPTVLAAVGVAPPANLPGRPLQPLLREGPASGWRQYIHAVTTGANPRCAFVQESVRDARWKLIWSPEQRRPNAHALSYLGDSAAWVSGLLPAERASLSPKWKEVYDRYENPPTYELYDLFHDPHELDNLAENPAFAAEKKRLIGALQAMQHRMVDPFMEPANVTSFMDEQIRHWAEQRRYNAGFRWSHTEQFRAWREQQAR